MSVIYRLKIPAAKKSLFKQLNSILEKHSQDEEINILSKSLDNSNSFNTSFRFQKWQELAEEKYLETNSFKSAIPILKPLNQDLENNVKKQLYEAAESEIIASRLTVYIDADQEKIIFHAEYEYTMTTIQIKQAGVYLQHRLKLLFGNLIENHKFDHIEVFLE